MSIATVSTTDVGTFLKQARPTAPFDVCMYYPKASYNLSGVAPLIATPHAEKSFIALVHRRCSHSEGNQMIVCDQSHVAIGHMR